MSSTDLLCTGSDVNTRDPGVRYPARQVSGGKLNKGILCGLSSDCVYIFIYGMGYCVCCEYTRRHTVIRKTCRSTLSDAQE